MATSTPSRSTDSAQSAPSRTSRSTSVPGGNGCSTQSATGLRSPRSGLPIPIRTRRKSCVPIASAIAVMVEAVPWQVRCTAIALGYNVTLGIVGGLSPLVATWLVARTHNDYSPAFMIMVAAAISFFAILTFKETYRTPLEKA